MRGRTRTTKYNFFHAHQRFPGVCDRILRDTACNVESHSLRNTGVTDPGFSATTVTCITTSVHHRNSFFLLRYRQHPSHLFRSLQTTQKPSNEPYLLSPPLSLSSLLPPPFSFVLFLHFYPCPKTRVPSPDPKGMAERVIRGPTANLLGERPTSQPEDDLETSNPALIIDPPMNAPPPNRRVVERWALINPHLPVIGPRAEKPLIPSKPGRRSHPIGSKTRTRVTTRPILGRTRVLLIPAACPSVFRSQAHTTEESIGTFSISGSCR